MARLITMMILLIAVQACVMLYHDATPIDNQVWTFVMNMDRWGDLTFILTLFSIAAGIGLVGIAASSIFGFKIDFLVLATAIGGLISIGYVFSNLATIVRADLINRVFTTCIGAPLMSCTPANFIVAITVGPFAFYYVWTVLEWWRGRDY